MPPEENSNKLILNKYYAVTDRVLGRGGFSTVYLAYHLIFRNKVALKVINRNDIKEDYVKRNLHREAKILMRLNHPNIVNFYQEVSQNELYCLSMEYINGVTLSQYLKRQDHLRVSEKIAKALFHQMISAVHHMHQNKILHRDLKQENILLEHGKVIKIIDFGLSNIFHNKAQLRTHCGSLVYAAPELFDNGSVYGSEVDVWSLGVILYTMVIGKMPFQITKHEGTSSSNFRRKKQFLARISKGLTGDNWNDMQALSIDCCNLLKHLLQPNQFERIPVKSAISHPWFYKDQDLRRRLPHNRPDLREKFKIDIIECMADKLNVSRERVRTHLQSFKHDTIYSIFCILQDTLMKEALYPPRNPQSTNLYKFETWKRDFEAKKRRDRERKTKSQLNPESISRYSQKRQEDRQLTSKPFFSYDLTEARDHSFPRKSKSEMDGFKKNSSIENLTMNRPYEQDNSISRFTKKHTTLKESGYETNNTELLEYIHEANAYPKEKIYPHKSYKNSRPDKSAISKQVVDEKHVKYYKDSGVEENDNIAFKNTMENLIEEKSVRHYKNSEPDSKKYPILRSYKNNKLFKNVAAEIAIKKNYQGNCKDSNIGNIIKSPTKSPSSVIEELACSNIKMKYLNKKDTEPCSANPFCEEINTTQIGNAPRAMITRKSSSAIEKSKHRKQEPPFCDRRFSEEAFSDKKFNYSRSGVKQYGGKPCNNSDSPVLVQSKTYIQRNIIVSRADRGSGRLFVNSNIPVRASRPSFPLKVDETFRNIEVKPRKQRMYCTTYSSSVSRKN